MDKLMFFISERFTWIPLYLLFVVLIIKKYKRDSWIIILLAVLTIVLSDQVANLIKNEVMRLRPTHNPYILHLLHICTNSDGESYMGGLYGFVSNHAANSAALSIYLILLFKNKYVTAGLILWVFLLCYSRVYLGVHYPSDVLGGITVGVIIGVITHKICMLLQKKLLARI